MNLDEIYMKRALQLAQLGRANVSPNPMVGCVIVKENQIIAEGYHQKYGEAHAEVNAIKQLSDTTLAQGADIYVTLEPCSHYGKTPPCAEALVRLRPKRVIIANTDPNPLVNGKGIEKLKQAGIDIVVGVCAQEAQQLNIRFFEYITAAKPYIILKWAQSLDGFIAAKNYKTVQLSQHDTNRYVHQWRSEEQAIMVGANTALYDNPQLTVRYWQGKNPIRLLFDPHLKVPHTHHIFDSQAPTRCYHINPVDSSRYNPSVTFVKVSQENWLSEILKELHHSKISSVLVEGGTKLHSAFIAQNLWNEIRLIQSEKLLGAGIEAPKFEGKFLQRQSLQTDTVYIYQPCQ